MAKKQSTSNRSRSRSSSGGSRSSGSRNGRSRSTDDAVSLLTADHNKVKKLFKQFEALHDDQDEAGAARIAAQICNELTVHATIEEEIFYPEVREALDDPDLMNEAEVEHATAKDLIAQIESMDSSDEKFAATVMVLGEYIDHHVNEEQDEMFPKAKRAKVDMAMLGHQLMTRKQELMAEKGMNGEEESAGEGSSTGRPRQRGTASRSRDARY